jgi:hypothetical protein
MEEDQEGNLDVLHNDLLIYTLFRPSRSIEYGFKAFMPAHAL